MLDIVKTDNRVGRKTLCHIVLDRRNTQGVSTLFSSQIVTKKLGDGISDIYQMDETHPLYSLLYQN